MVSKKVTAKIEVKKLPKYYSSKLITRNQSGFKLHPGENIELSSQIELGIAVSSTQKPLFPSKQEGDIVASTIGGLNSQEPSPEVKSIESQRELIEADNYFDASRRPQSTFKLKTLQKFHQSARSVTTRPIQ